MLPSAAAQCRVCVCYGRVCVRRDGSSKCDHRMYDQVSFSFSQEIPRRHSLGERGNIPFIRSPLLLIPGGVINGLALKNQLLNWRDARTVREERNVAAPGPGRIMCAWVVF